VCFALDDGRVVTAVDHKPKTTTALARLGDVERTGRATLLVDHYEDTDWSTLWWVRVTGAAAVLPATDAAARAAVDRLVEKYEQYRAHRPEGPVIALSLDAVTAWRASP
jgi:PPOX class probable F420-dependent enzyme